VSSDNEKKEKKKKKKKLRFTRIADNLLQYSGYIECVLAAINRKQKRKRRGATKSHDSQQNPTILKLPFLNEVIKPPVANSKTL
jgi:hypothetical protein